MKNVPLDPTLELILQDYHHYCHNVRGLTPITSTLRLERARLFLIDMSDPDPVILDQLTASDVIGYLGRVSVNTFEGTLPDLISCVRCFLRYLHMEGRITMALDQVLPPIAHPITAPPPKYLSPDQLKKLLESMDRSHPLGRRDYAIVLSLARLGLRAGEIARLKIEDVDWQQGTFGLSQTKSRRARQLPLPQAVGQAWVKYLRHGRPPTVLREMFVSAHQPACVMTTKSISKVVTRAVVRAGLSLPSRGAHLLRHTLATHLVQNGASLKAVADRANA